MEKNEPDMGCSILILILTVLAFTMAVGIQGNKLEKRIEALESKVKQEPTN